MNIFMMKKYGNNLVTMDQGAIFYNDLKKCIDNKELVILDFDSVSVIASPFFNSSISYFVKVYGLNTLKEFVSIKNIPDYARSILNISIHNALSMK